tara:strand:+ start:790 stop:2043 length:1254 start_codon:yes stop_codon:yes gene_type:complete
MSNTKEEVKEEVKVTAADNTPTKTEGDFKIKSAKKMKNLGTKATTKITKLDLSKAQDEIKKEEKDAVQTQKTDDSNVIIEKQENSSDGKEVVEDVRTTEEKIESPLQLITDEENDTDKSGVAGSNEATTSSPEQKEILQETKTQKLPENIDKLIKFMEETGGSIEDYSRLNADYTNINDDALLHEYYKSARPHLNSEERSFVIEDSFSFDTELDEARDIRKKKLAYKEEVAKAKNYLEDLKGKYYDEIKLRPGVTQEQQKATDFFNRYNEEQNAAKVKHERFITKTKEVLTNDFKGFDFKLGEQKFRYGIKDPSNIADKQSDISNFIGKYLDKNGEISDHKGYHKALYAAQNADTIANHFYEQGKTDAIKTQLARSKNINIEPRPVASGDVFKNGFKVKAISELDSSQLKIRKKKFN